MTLCFLDFFSTTSRVALSTWMCELHNMVNKDTGKPNVHDCTPFALDLQYLKDCGEEKQRECCHASAESTKSTAP